MEKCIHCKYRKAAKWRKGLCHGCASNAEIRLMYHTKSIYGYRSDVKQGPKKPCQPTTARCGTEEKIQVLAERAANNEELFHELDP